MDYKKDYLYEIAPDCYLDLASHELLISGNHFVLHLEPAPIKCLEYLAMNHNFALTYNQILDHSGAWEEYAGVERKSVQDAKCQIDSCIKAAFCSAREKRISIPDQYDCIQTVRGYGYKFVAKKVDRNVVLDKRGHKRSFKIIRNDITKMCVDAIVNPSNVSLIPGGGIDAAIHKAAGPQLRQECQLIGGCPVGEARLSKGYNLNCKYVIHTVGPVWWGGDYGERDQLVSCYRSCLELAKNQNCHSIALPLISAGLYGFPKNQVIAVALDAISQFLFDFDNEMMIYLVIFDKQSFDYCRLIFPDIAEYVDDTYLLEHPEVTYSWEREYLLSFYENSEKE